MRFHRRLQLIVGIAVVAALLAAGLSLFLRSSTSTAYALVDQTTLTVLQGRVEYLPNGQTNWRAASGGEVLGVGDRVRTAADSYALITFFEGTTTEIEPNSEVAITRMGRPESTGAIDLGLEQAVGVTWNRVVKIADTQSRMEIRTTAATVMVRGTEFKFTVSPDSTAEVVTTMGSVEFQSAGVSVAVEAGYLSVAQPGAPPTPPTPAPPPSRALTISLAGAASVFVTDARGRSLGLFPETGSYINQIPDAWYSGSRSDPQVLRLGDPTTSYRVVIAPIPQGQKAANGALVAGWYSADRTFLASPSYYAEQRSLAAASGRFRLDLSLRQSGSQDSQDFVEDELGDDDTSYSMDLEVGENGLRRGNLNRRNRSNLQLPRQVISRMEMRSGVLPTPIPTRPATATATRNASPAAQPTSAATVAPTRAPTVAPTTQSQPPTPLPIAAQSTTPPTAVPTTAPTTAPTPVPTATVAPAPTPVPTRVPPTAVPPTEAPLVDVPAPEPTSAPTAVPPTATRAPTRPPLPTATPLPPPSWRLLPQ